MKGRLRILNGTLSSHPARKWFILTTVLIGAAMSALDLSIINVAMPTLKSALGVSLSVIEWLTMAYMLGLIVFLPLFGKLADIYGRAKLYNIGFIIFSAGSLLCGMSSTAAFLITFRVIQAIGAGLLQANSVALIVSAFPANERGRAIGIQSVVQAISMAIGPVVGGILISAVSWRAVFLINVPIGIFGTLAALLMLPADRQTNPSRNKFPSWMLVVPPVQEKEKEKIDFLGAVLFASGLSFIVLAVNEGAKLGWGSGSITAYFISGVILLTLFMVVELKVKHPLIDLRLFKDSTFLLGNLAGMLSYYVLFSILFLMPFYLEGVMGYSVALTGFLLTPLLLAMAAVAPFSGYISDKYGPRIMTTSGMLIAALACFSLMFIGASARLPLLVAALISLGAGMGLFITPNNSAVMGAAPREKLGAAGGILNMTRSLGLIFGVCISGVIITTLQRHYLAEGGYSKTNAFMHGLIMVIMVLIVVATLSALLSSVRKIKSVPIIDHHEAGTAILSSSFFNGFDREAKRISLFLVLLLFVSVGSSFASSRLTYSRFPGSAVAGSCEAGQEQKVADARKLALAYYAQKYHDTGVDVAVTPSGDQMEAEIRKNGQPVKRLSVKNGMVSERWTCLRDIAFDLLVNIN
ncbi:MAG: MFS transporter [Nitrospirota bacterium]